MTRNQVNLVWYSEIDELSEGILHFRLFNERGSLSFSDVSVLLQDQPEFQSWFTQQLKNAPMDAYFWETAPVTTRNFARDFEYVLVSAPHLSRMPADPSAFSDRFATARTGIVQFHNLGKDAVLVAPVPLQRNVTYTHLASFLRTAPEIEIYALWKKVFQTLTRILSHRPVWVSTSGLGVPWLHVRLDSIPKYYNYDPYKLDTG